MGNLVNPTHIPLGFFFFFFLIYIYILYMVLKTDTVEELFCTWLPVQPSFLIDFQEFY